MSEAGHGESHGSHEKSGGKKGGLRRVLVDQFLDVGQIFESHDALGDVTRKTADVGIQTAEALMEPGKKMLSGESGKTSSAPAHH